MAPDTPRVLVWLTSHRHVVEVLAALAERPQTSAELRAGLHAKRRHLDTALRTLAAHRAIRRRDQHGSWDHHDTASIRYELTDAGRHLTHQFDRLDVWVAIYEYYLYGTPGDDT